MPCPICDEGLSFYYIDAIMYKGKKYDFAMCENDSCPIYREKMIWYCKPNYKNKQGKYIIPSKPKGYIEKLKTSYEL